MAEQRALVLVSGRVQQLPSGDTLAGAAAPTHAHAISDVTGLQTALDAKQALDADLTAIAALTGTGIARRTGTNTWSVGTTVATAEIANAAVTLAKLANLAQDQFIGRTTASTGVPQTATITAAARTVLDDTTVAAMVNTLGGATSTGSGGLVRATSPTLVSPALGTPASGVLTNCTGLPTAGLVNDAVTYAKMQNVSATQRVLGRNTAGAGDPEEVTAAQLLDWLGSTRGSVLYRGASGWTVLTPGTAGYVLTSQGAGADPVYAEAAGGSSDLSNLIDGMTSELAANASRVYSSHLTITDDGELKVPATSSVTIAG
jgi:hypothetical protein